MFINGDADVKHTQTLFSHVILTNDTMNGLGCMFLRTIMGVLAPRPMPG